MSTQTNWYVITGGPSSGITTTVTHLGFLGYSTMPEVARVVIEDERSKGRTTKEIRDDEISFQTKLLQIKDLAEARIPQDQLTFLERGMEDSIVYLQENGGDSALAREVCGRRVYAGVFVLDQLPEFEEDGVRTENREKARRISQLLHETYSTAGYSVTRVPIMSIGERARFILDKL